MFIWDLYQILGGYRNQASSETYSALRFCCAAVYLQIVEAMVCMFQDDLSSKRVNAGVPDVETFVDADMQCRSCSNDETTVTDLQRILLEHQCMTESDTCRYYINLCL